MKLAIGFILFEDSTLRYLADFLPSLKQALGFLSPDDYRIYVVDNSRPSDERNERLFQELEKTIFLSPATGWTSRYERPGENLGFSRAYNLMIRRALLDGAEYFLIVNPDTKLASESIVCLLSALDSNERLGSVAPKILRWDYEKGCLTNIIDSLGIVLKRGLSFSDFGQGDPDQAGQNPESILGPSGAAGLYRLSALIAVAENKEVAGHEQFFDENFFMYKEDCDLAYRLFLAGYPSALIPEAVIYHDRTAVASGRNLLAKLKDRRSKSRLIRKWSLRNQLYIYRKHWAQQDVSSKLVIVGRVLIYWFYALILERYLLKEFFLKRYK